MKKLYLKNLIILFMLWANFMFAQSYSESFDDVSMLTGKGWFIQNNSNPLGQNSWYQGVPTTATPDPGPFNAYNGQDNAYIAANFASTTGGYGTISNWLVTPNRTLRNGDVFTFYTRKPTIAGGQTDYPDRLEVRMSTNGASTNTGSGATATGDFTTLLLSINPTLVANVYPQVWTQYSITISGLSAPTSGRIAFRYFVTVAGPSGTNSDYIGIDQVDYTPYVCPAFTMTPGGALAGGSAGSAYSTTLSQTGALGTPSYAVTAGALPPGLTLSSIGTISGTPTATGTFNFTATVSDASGCSGSQAYSITVVCGSSPITIANAPILCSNSGLYTLIEASPAGGTYSGTGVSGGQFDPSVGTQTITYEYTDPYGCFYSSTFELSVNDAQIITSQPSASTVCAGASATFIVTASNAAGYQWQVDNGSGFADLSDAGVYSGSTSSTLTIIGATSDMSGYQYRVVVSGATGCNVINSDTAALTVNALTEITSQPSTNAICVGASATFSVTANNATGYQWQVDNGSGFVDVSDDAVYSGSTSSTLTISGATSDMSGYQYRVVALGSCGNQNSEEVVLTVNSTSAPTGAVEQTVKTGDDLTQLVVVGEGVKWYATASDATNHTNSLATSTIIVDDTRYYATQTVNGCESRTYLEVLARINDLSVEGFDKSSKIVLYPNPAKHMLTISTDARLINVGVLSLEGKPLFNKKINHNNQIDVSSLPAGVYLLKIETEKGLKVEKFIKD